MLKLVSKFVLEILPGVLASVIGAYLVHHFITARSEPPPAGQQVIALPKEDVEKLLSAVQATIRTATKRATPSESAATPRAPTIPVSASVMPEPSAASVPKSPDVAAAAPALPPRRPTPAHVAVGAPANTTVAVGTPISPTVTPAPPAFGQPSLSVPSVGSTAVIPVIRADLSPPVTELSGPMVLAPPSGLASPGGPASPAGPAQSMPAPTSGPARAATGQSHDPVQLSEADRAKLSDIPLPPEEAAAAREPIPERVRASGRAPSVIDWGEQVVGGVVRSVTSILPDFTR